MSQMKELNMEAHKRNLVAAAIDAAIPTVVKIICLDVLYDRASQHTIELAATAVHEVQEQYNIVRLFASANPKYADSLFWEALPLVEEAIYGHFVSRPEDIDLWRNPVVSN